MNKSIADTCRSVRLRDSQALKGLQRGYKSLHGLVGVGYSRFQQPLLLRHCRLPSKRRIHGDDGDASTNKTSSTHEEAAKSSSSSWWKDIMTMSQVVPNTGSIARDILAAERTFLAWSRTGLGFVGAGTALFTAFHQSNELSNGNRDNDSGVDQRNTDSRATLSTDHAQHSETSSNLTINNLLFYPTLASALLVGNGAFLLVFATRRYLRTVTLMTRHMDHSLFPIDTKGTLIAVAVTASSTLTSLGLVLSMARDSPFNISPR